MSDYYYLHALSHQCQVTGRTGLPDDIYITPCGGTKYVGYIASLFLGQKVRPLVLLDGDQAARARRDALIKELYAEHQTAILMLDDALGQTGAHIEVEDILGETISLPAVNTVLGQELKLSDADRKAGSLPTQIKVAAKCQSIELPEGWKASVAIHLVSAWAEHKTVLPGEVLDRAATVLTAIRQRFDSASAAHVV